MPPTERGFHLLAKPAGAACNLGCKYCFFLSKENLYPGDSPLMDEATLESHIRQLFESTPGPQVHVAWQGGEPMLRGLDFYRRSVELAARHRKPHQRVLHTIQTNGTLVDDEWAAFFKENGYLVGLSIDGPREMHDAYRVNKQGGGSFDEVMRGWNVLRRHDVDVNVLCTIHAANQDHPLEVYRFFRDELKAEYIQLIPIVERATPETIALANEGWGGPRGRDRPLYRQEGSLVTERTVDAAKFGAFLIAIFDEWVQRDVGTVFVATFDVALGSWMGQHNLCIVSPTCGSALALEHNGDVYSCDHFVEPDHRLGNIKETPLAALVVVGEAARASGRPSSTRCRSTAGSARCCSPATASARATASSGRPTARPGSTTCARATRRSSPHIDPPMKTMANLIRQGRYADEIMEAPR